MGERVHALPRAEHGDMQDCVEDARCGSRVRGGDSEGGDVDDGAGSGIGSDNEPHWYQ